MHGRQLLSSGLNHAGYSDGLLRRAALYLACIAGDNSSIASSTPPSAVSPSYAAVICWKRSPLAAQPGLTSGCVCRARSRYACLMASGVAPRLRPSCASSLERDAAAICVAVRPAVGRSGARERGLNAKKVCDARGARLLPWPLFMPPFRFSRLIHARAGGLYSVFAAHVFWATILHPPRRHTLHIPFAGSALLPTFYSRRSLTLSASPFVRVP